MLVKNLIGALGFASAVSAQLMILQCGGQGWSGPMNCGVGKTCISYNPYFWACMPKSDFPDTTTTRPTIATTTTTPAETTSVEPKTTLTTYTLSLSTATVTATSAPGHGGNTFITRTISTTLTVPVNRRA